MLVNAHLGRRRRRGEQPDGECAPLDGEIVFDLVYVPAETQLLADARAAGCMTIGGLEMLVAQAETQFEIWTGQTPPAGLFPAGRRDRTDRMKQTTFEEFVDLSRRGTFVPVVKEIIADLLTPVSAFLKIAEHSDYAFLFESVEGGERVARYSFLGKDPFLVLKASAGQDDHRPLRRAERERRALHRRSCAG